jgi:cytoskeletal protein CcmA (bactofilin family)
MSTFTTTGSGTLSSYDDYIVMYADSMWRIVGQGPETTSTGSYTQGADYAEWIDYSGSVAPQPGDVLSASPSGTIAVNESTKAYDSALVGVVSTNPYQVGGNNNGHSVVLALTGRVPVKVSLQNGPILPGDPLTSSSIPGVAMKATAPGEIIGTALEGYNGTSSSNEIMVQLHVGYDNPNAQNGILQGNQSVSGSLNVSGNTVINGSTSVQGSLDVSNNLNVSGVGYVNKLLVKNSLQDNGNLAVSGTAIINNLQLQSGNVTGNLNVSGNTSLSALLVANNLAVSGNISVSGSANITSLSVSGNTSTQNLSVSGTLSLAGDIQLTGQVNTKQATIKTFIASTPISAGDVVILDTSPGHVGDVTTTSTNDDPRVIGVAVTSTTQKASPIQVAINGWVQVNVANQPYSGVVPPQITPGQLIVTSHQAGDVTSMSNPAPGTILGKSTSAQDSNNQIWVYVTLE